MCLLNHRGLDKFMSRKKVTYEFSWEKNIVSEEINQGSWEEKGRHLIGQIKSKSLLVDTVSFVSNNILCTNSLLLL